jgi:hypothetical protein
MFEDALCFGIVQGKANCAQAIDVQARIWSMWERLSVGEIAVKTEVVLFHDTVKVGLPLAREKKRESRDRVLQVDSLERAVRSPPSPPLLNHLNRLELRRG